MAHAIIAEGLLSKREKYMPEIIKTWTEWLGSSRFAHLTETQKQQTLAWLLQVRDKILDRADIKSGDTIIDIGAGTGLLAFGAYERLKETGGRVIISDAFADCIEECANIVRSCGIEDEITFLQSDAADIKLADSSVDIVVMRSVLVHIIDKAAPVKEFYRILKAGSGRISIFEPIMSKNTKFYELINPENFHNYDRLVEIENEITSDKNDPLMNFNEETLKKNFEEAGFKNIDIDVVIQSSTYQVLAEAVDPWFNTPPSPGRPTVREKYLKYMPENEVNEFIEKIKLELAGKIITINSPTAYIYAEKQV